MKQTEKACTDQYLDIVIRNTEILTNFTNLVERIELLVQNLPDNKDYQKQYDDLNKIKDMLNDLVLLYKTNMSKSQSNYDKIDKLHLLCDTIINIKDEISFLKEILNTVKKISSIVENLNVWAKIKLPFIMATFTLIIYSIGFYINWSFWSRSNLP